MAASPLLLGVATGRWPEHSVMLVLGMGAFLVVALVAARPELALWVLVAGVPVLSNELGLVLGGVVLVVWAFSTFRQDHYGLVATSLDPAVTGVGLVLLVGTLLSVSPVGSLPDLACHVVGIGLFLAAANWLNDRRRVYQLALALVGVMTLVSVIGVYQYIARVPPAESGWVDLAQNPYLRTRAYSLFGNPNVLATYLLLVMPMALALAVSSTRLVKKGAFYGAFAVAGVCMLFTFSRGGWMALYVSVVAFAVVASRKLLIAIVLVTILFTAIVPRVDVIDQRLGSIKGAGDSSLSYRTVVWKEALLMIIDHWPSGVGLGHRAYMKVYPEYMLDRQKKPYHSHNQFLQLLIELGVPGLAAFAWLFFRVLRLALHLARRERDRLLAAIAAAVGSAMLGLLTMGLTDNLLYRPKIILSLWLVMGMLAAVDAVAHGPSAARTTPSVRVGIA
jgi:hypothetical protein